MSSNLQLSNLQSLNPVQVKPATALVTGGAHRLGRAFALALARMGYDIVLHYNHSSEQADQTAAELRALNVNVTLVQADLTDSSSFNFLLSSLDQIVHPLRILINSAARMSRADVRTLSADEWDATFDLNLRAPFLLAQQAAKRMTSGGLIVNVTDVAAQKAWTGFPAYTVSKAALESLTKVLARAFAPSIRVNAIAPGLALRADDLPEDQWQKLIDKTPLRRAAALEEISGALEFLLKNEYITGQTIVVDGGYSLV
jgi:pteridine reductase